MKAFTIIALNESKEKRMIQCQFESKEKATEWFFELYPLWQGLYIVNGWNDISEIE